MSDEVFRSAPGNPPDQRRDHPAPSWWSELERGDLPDDFGVAPSPRGEDGPPTSDRLRSLWWRSPVSTLGVPYPHVPALIALVVALAGLVAWLAVGLDSMRGALVTSLLIAGPAASAGAAAWLVVRRGD